MTATLRVLAVLLAAGAGCSGDSPAEVVVRARFEAFQRAVQAADSDALCDLVTRESLPAIEQIGRAASAKRCELVVEAVEQLDRGRFEVAVREASADGTSGIFVVLREDGVWRVDLVESAIVTHGVEDGPTTIEPAGLTPAQIDEIRADQGMRLP